MNCDPIAHWYRSLEYLAFGRALERRRFEYLRQVTDARRALVLGDGDGRFLAEFEKRNPNAEVDAIDLSGRMIELARTRVSSAQVRFRVGDARTIALGNDYDLVVTHFFLDCFPDADVEQLVARIAGHCKPGARWVISEFGLPDGLLARVAAKVFIRILYFCFRLTTGLTVTHLPNYGMALERGGFRLVQRRRAWGGLLVSEMWRL